MLTKFENYKFVFRNTPSFTEEVASRFDFAQLLPLTGADTAPSMADLYHLIEGCLLLHTSRAGFSDNGAFRYFDPLNQIPKIDIVKALAKFAKSFAYTTTPSYEREFLPIPVDAEYDELTVADEDENWFDKTFGGLVIERKSDDKKVSMLLKAEDIMNVYEDLSALRRFVIRVSKDDKGGYRDQGKIFVSGPYLFGKAKRTEHVRSRIHANDPWEEVTEDYSTISQCRFERSYENGSIQSQTWSTFSGEIHVGANPTSASANPPLNRGILDYPSQPFLLATFVVHGRTPSASYPTYTMSYGFDLIKIQGQAGGWNVNNFNPADIASGHLMDTYAGLCPQWASDPNRSFRCYMVDCYFDTGEIQLPSKLD